MTEQDDQTSNPAQNWDISLRQTSTWRCIAVAPTWLAAGVLFLLMSMTFADVDLRSLFGNPIESATELTRLFMAALLHKSYVGRSSPYPRRI